jgi:hypothetical protein
VQTPRAVVRSVVRVTVRSAASSFLVIGLVAGCGGGSKASSVKSKASASPFDDLFGTSDQFKERQRKVEEKIAQCMKDKGWTYTPVDVDRAFGSPTGENFDEPTFRLKYGYGISIQPEQTPGNDKPFIDPNGEFVNRLPEGEQQQYYKDLEGPESVAPVDTPINDEPITAPPLADRKGCRAEGERSVGGNVFDDPKYTKVFETLGQGLENDPRIAEATDKWSVCMKQGGFTYAKPDDIFQSLQNRMTVLQGGDPNDVGGGPVVATTAAPASTGAPIPIEGGGIGTGGNYREPDPVELKKLQADELAIAKVDAGCTKKHLDKVRKQVEQELYDQIIQQFPELKKK